MHLNIKKVLFHFFQILVFLIPISLALLLTGTYIFGDDIYQLYFDNKTFLDFFKYVDHGCLVSVFFMKLVGSFLPELFCVHPADNTAGLIFRGCTISFIILLLHKFFIISTNDKNTKQSLYLPSYFLLTIAFIFLFANFGSAEAYNCFYIMAKHTRYMFSMIAYLLFWYLGFKQFILKIPPKKADLIYWTISALWLGVSVESANISTFITIAILLTINCFTSSYNLKKKKYIIVISLFLAGIIYSLTNQGFTDIAASRGLSHFVFNVKNYFIEFTEQWFYSVFIANNLCVLTTLNIILSAILLKKEKYSLETKKITIFAWCLVFGIAIFQFSLLFLGKTYYIQGQFWVQSGALKLDTMIVQLAALCIISGKLFTIEKTDVLTQRSNLLNVTSIFLIIFFVINLIAPSNILRWNHYLKENRRTLYKTEKMYLFYARKGQTATLSDDILKSMFAGEFLGLEGWKTPAYITVLYPKIYGTKPTNFIIVPDAVAMGKYYSQGGSFHKGEIYKAKFTTLLSNNKSTYK